MSLITGSGEQSYNISTKAQIERLWSITAASEADDMEKMPCAPLIANIEEIRCDLVRKMCPEVSPKPYEIRLG